MVESGLWFCLGGGSYWERGRGCLLKCWQCDVWSGLHAAVHLESGTSGMLHLRSGKEKEEPFPVPLVLSSPARRRMPTCRPALDWAPQCLMEPYPLCCLGQLCIVSALFWGPHYCCSSMCLSFHSRSVAGSGSALPASLQPDPSEVAASEADVIFKVVL